jgi:hypothetical protein
MIPSSRPKQKKDDTLRVVKAHKVTDPVVLVGVRGYYSKMAAPKGANSRGVYDDALILVSSGGDVHATFNASVDPDLHGKNPKVGKGYASLKPGVYRYKLGLHGIRRGNPYKALVQAAPVTVVRDCGIEETGWYGINVHRGAGPNSRGPGSEGCTVVPPGAQWNAFIALVESELKRNNAKTISYVLTSNS